MGLHVLVQVINKSRLAIGMYAKVSLVLVKNNYTDTVLKILSPTFSNRLHK